MGLGGGGGVRNRALPMLAAFHDVHLPVQFFLPQPEIEALHLIFAQGHGDAVDLRTAGKGAQRMDQDGRAADLKKLLGGLAFPAGRRHPSPESGRWNDREYFHRSEKSIAISRAISFPVTVFGVWENSNTKGQT